MEEKAMFSATTRAHRAVCAVHHDLMQVSICRTLCLHKQTTLVPLFIVVPRLSFLGLKVAVNLACNARLAFTPLLHSLFLKLGPGIFLLRAKLPTLHCL